MFFLEVTGLVTFFKFTSKISPLQGASHQDLFNLDVYCLRLRPSDNDTGSPGISSGLERRVLGQHTEAIVSNITPFKMY